MVSNNDIVPKAILTRYGYYHTGTEVVQIAEESSITSYLKSWVVDPNKNY